MTEENKPRLTLVEGGKMTENINPDENWLANLPRGAVFLYRPYGTRRVILNIRQILFHWGEVALLSASTGDETPPTLEYVDTKLFSNVNEHVKTIYIAPTEEELQKEQDNDGDPVRSEEME